MVSTLLHREPTGGPLCFDHPLGALFGFASLVMSMPIWLHFGFQDWGFVRYLLSLGHPSISEIQIAIG